MATKYIVSGEGFETVTRSEKPKAIELADKLRAEHKTTVTVTTDKGREVYVTKQRKAQKRTAPFTRVDERDYAKLLGEGVRIPRGFDVAYLRPRSTVATLRKVTEDSVDYLVFDLASGGRAAAETTREAGAIMKAVKKGELTLAV